MGELVAAAKITHVPTMYMSEQPGRLHGLRKPAIDGHFEIARRAKELDVDTVVVCDTHWLINAGYHVNSNTHFRGTFTSHEFPQFIQGLDYEYEGNPQVGDLIAEKANPKGDDIHMLSHQIDSLSLEYGTLVPMRYMSQVHPMKVVSVAAMCETHSHASSRKVGEAIREGIEASDSRVMLLASGSLSHHIWPNEDYAPNNGTFTISREFNRQVDLHVLKLWTEGEHDTFLKMLPHYAEFCDGEGNMHDTVMLYGALGWDQYDKECEIITPYFPSSGTGQVNVWFPV